MPIVMFLGATPRKGLNLEHYALGSEQNPPWTPMGPDHIRIWTRVRLVSPRPSLAVLQCEAGQVLWLCLDARLRSVSVALRLYRCVGHRYAPCGFKVRRRRTW